MNFERFSSFFESLNHDISSITVTCSCSDEWKQALTVKDWHDHRHIAWFLWVVETSHLKNNEFKCHSFDVGVDTHDVVREIDVTVDVET